MSEISESSSSDVCTTSDVAETSSSSEVSESVDYSEDVSVDTDDACLDSDFDSDNVSDVEDDEGLSDGEVEEEDAELSGENESFSDASSEGIDGEIPVKDGPSDLGADYESPYEGDLEDSADSADFDDFENEGESSFEDTDTSDAVIDSSELSDSDDGLEESDNEPFEEVDTSDAVTNDDADVGGETESSDEASDVERNEDPLAGTTFEKMSPEEQEVYLDAMEKEPAITEDMKEMSEASGGELVGLEHRCKSPSSTVEKLHERGKSKDIQEVNDLVRYTETLEPSEYSEGVNKSLDDLESRGYSIDKVKNTWDDDSNPYKGVNVQMTSPSGQKCEVQFHTPESFEAKNGEMHELYEKQRVLDSDDPRYAEYEDEMWEISDNLERPSDVDRIRR